MAKRLRPQPLPWRLLGVDLFLMLAVLAIGFSAAAAEKARLWVIAQSSVDSLSSTTFHLLSIETAAMLADWTRAIIILEGLLIAVGVTIIVAWARGGARAFQIGAPRSRWDPAALSLLLAVNDPVLVLDADWKVVEANDRARALYACSHDGLVQRSWLEFSPEADHETTLAQLGHLAQTDGLAVDLAQQRGDGSLFWVAASLRACELDGKRIYLAALRDITAEKLAEQAQQAREKSYHSLFEQMPAFCQVIDAEGRLVEVNSSWSVVLGYARDEVIGERFDRFLTPYSCAAFQTILADLRGRGSVQGAVVEVIRKDGSMLVTAFSARSLFDASGQLQEATCLLVDVTEQRRVADQVRRLNEELEQRVLKRTTQLQAAVHELEAFSYSVSHDLRAPLRAIDGFSRILVEEYASNFPAEAVHYLELVRENAQTMGNLIDHLLSFSRLNRAPLKKQPVDPNQLVAQCLTTLTSQINGRKIDFELNELPPCQADPTLLKQVYINLLSNAIKFTGREAHAVIEVGCRKEGAERVYYVKDNGVGFDMQYAPKLFGVFQRLHRAEDYEGTGVGLAIVQRIIHRHGGRVWATAQVNGGATFSFTLDGNGQHA